MERCAYGFRVVGPLTESRRLVDAAAALSGYAACDDRAEVTEEGYLSAFQFGNEFRRHLEMTGSTKRYDGPCWSPWLWWDIDRDELSEALEAARGLATHLDERYCLPVDSLLLFFSIPSR